MREFAKTAQIMRLVIFFGMMSLAGVTHGHHSQWEGFENTGVTAANVRMWFVREHFIWMEYWEYRLLDLNQFERYHEFHEATVWHPRIMLTTENTVRDFSLLLEALAKLQFCKSNRLKKHVSSP